MEGHSLVYRRVQRVLARHPWFSEDVPELTRIFGPCRKKNITPWDKDKPQPALRELIESNAVELPRGKDKSALVPGCGSVSSSCLCAANHSVDSKQGNDVAYLAAALEVSTVGVDVSEKAVEVAAE